MNRVEVKKKEINRTCRHIKIKFPFLGVNFHIKIKITINIVKKKKDVKKIFKKLSNFNPE